MGLASGQILAANYLFWKSVFPILPNIKTFISGFKEEGYNEYLYAEKVTKFLQLKQPYRLDIKENE